MDTIKIPVYRLTKKRVASEIERFHKAIEVSRNQLTDLQKEVEDKLGSKDAMIFAVHIQLLEDSNLRKKVESKVREDLLNIEAAIKEVISWYAAQIDELSDSVLSDKSADIRDVGNRVIRNLLAHEHNHLMERTESFIMLTHELLPSDTAHMDVSKLVAVVTEVGGKASHAAILARSLSIPAVTGVALNTLPTDLGEVLVDGREGILIINPTQKDKDLYASKKEVFLKFKEKLLSRVHEMPATQDGTPIDILTNIENFEDINPVDYETLNGIGLYRTEYIFMNRNSFPSEEEQYQFYSTIVKRVGPDKEITFRTIDIGGDKKLPYFKAPDEANPVLGWRGARIILEWPDIFYTQVRALLRAGVHGWVNIMIPMVTDLEEVRCANRYFKEIQDDLRKHGIPYGENLKLGVMIEVPSAAWDIKNIVLETEFVSIGTNDLIQYILAV
ncbi:MAG: phosphoenolpyruvate--protein phosphotransferase, partial [Planctomycetota bacterium]